MTSRYDDIRIRTNFSKKYKEIFKKRNVNFINQYMTPTLKFPSTSEILEVVNYSHAWKLGDRFYKLADQYYKDSSLWWIIAWYNKRPTEAHVKIGDIITVPLPLDKVLQILEI